jgi:beta-mannosidase
MTLSGEVLQCGSQPVQVDALGSSEVACIRPDIPAGQARKVVFCCDLLEQERTTATVLASFVPDKHLALADPHLALEVNQAGAEAVISVKAQSLARFVELAVEGADVVFSDNYFDLPAQRAVQITCPIPEGWSLEELRQAVRVSSLFESYN